MTLKTVVTADEMNERERDLFFGMQQRTGRCPKVIRMSFPWRSGDFLSSDPHRKPVFLVDSIIELCINVQEILEFAVLNDVAL